MTRALLEVRDLTLRFGAITAFEDVSFDVAAASCSPSSARTAPARARCSTPSRASTSPTAGSVRLDGRDFLRCGPTELAGAAASRAASRTSASSRI